MNMLAYVCGNGNKELLHTLGFSGTSVLSLSPPAASFCSCLEGLSKSSPKNDKSCGSITICGVRKTEQTREISNTVPLRHEPVPSPRSLRHLSSYPAVEVLLLVCNNYYYNLTHLGVWFLWRIRLCFSLCGASSLK